MTRREPRERWGRSAAGIVEAMRLALEREGLAENHAQSLACVAYAALVGHANGRALYLPRGRRRKNQERDSAIGAGFNAGRTVQQLAREHNLCPRRIEQIVKGLRAAKQAGRLKPKG